MGDINEHILEEIGEQLRIQREKIYYTLKDVANMTGLTTNTIAAAEKGKGASLNNFILICRALKIQPHTIFKKEIDLFSMEPYYALIEKIELENKLTLSKSNLYTTHKKI